MYNKLMDIIKYFEECRSKKIRCFVIDKYCFNPKYYKEIISCREDYIVYNEYNVSNNIKNKTDSIWKYSPYWKYTKIYNMSKIRDKLF